MAIVSGRGRRRRTSTPPASSVAFVKKEPEFSTQEKIEKEESIESTIAYIGGPSMIVDYYLSLYSNDDLSNSGLDESLSAAKQSYDYIKDMELKVTTAIDVGDPSSVGGSALIYSGLIPNVGDMFKLVLSGNKESLFKVTEIERKTYNDTPVYEITYILDSFIKDDIARYENLKSKVAANYAFDRSRLLDNVSPILTTSTYTSRKTIADALEGLFNTFLRVSIDKRLEVLRLPGQDFIITDPYLENFVFKTLEFTNPELININRVNTDYNILPQDSLWQCILDRDIGILKYVKRTFTVRAVDGTLYIPTIANSIVRNSGITSPIRVNKVGINILPNFAPTDYTYMFTSNFFNNPESPEISKLERVVLKYFNVGKLEYGDFKELVDTYKFWTPLEQHYYIPLVIYLIKYTLRSS